MKWIITKAAGTRKKDKNAITELPQDSEVRIVSFADTTSNLSPRIGEPFTVILSSAPNPQAQRATPSPSSELLCKFVGDGRSLLVGNQIVRVTNAPQTLKRNAVRIRAGSAGVVRDHHLEAERFRPVQPKKSSTPLGVGNLQAPMTGKIIKVFTEQGKLVKEGDLLVIIEAMKMENQIKAEGDGVVAKVHVGEGQAIKVGELLLTLAPPTAIPKA
jgi:biotin carboxyl carrier protein